MPSWDQIRSEIHSSPSPHDAVRRDYLKRLSDYTGRNVIAYYSGWMEKSDLINAGLTGVEVTDSDKNGLMATIHEMDRSKGLDLILHTPGGNIAATESIVDYLRCMFGTDIRAIVPHLSMSAGTMIALSCKLVIMGKHSSLGPIDPQIGGVPAHGIVEEFEKAKEEISADPSSMAVWQPILAKYPATFIGECQKSITWANTMVTEWLETGMFDGQSRASALAKEVVREFSDHSLTYAHDRHIPPEKAKSHGVRVEMLENDEELQELVLSVHHAFVLSLSETPAFKIIENGEGASFITSVRARSA